MISLAKLELAQNEDWECIVGHRTTKGMHLAATRRTRPHPGLFLSSLMRKHSTLIARATASGINKDMHPDQSRIIER